MRLYKQHMTVVINLVIFFNKPIMSYLSTNVGAKIVKDVCFFNFDQSFEVISSEIKNDALKHIVINFFAF
jgi:hypothetical protein